MERYAVEYKGHSIEFELHRKKVKHLNLRVRPDLSVMVSAHKRVPLEYIQNFVKAKSAWILQAQNHFKNTPTESAAPREYQSGEAFKYLGKQLRLQVEESEQEGIKYGGGGLNLTVSNMDDYSRRQKLVEDWFRDQADILFQESLERIFPLVEKYGLKQPEFTVKNMKSRWGSCTRHKNLITLNLQLIKAPKGCIDYVVLHELLHFKHGNHGRDFYDLMTALMPDWRDRKKSLEAAAAGRF